MNRPQSSHLINISKSEVTNEDRLIMFPKYFKKYYLRVETLIYSYMEHLCPSYNGDYWRMFELSNGGFYMAPASEKSYDTHCLGFFGTVMLSADAAGLVACLFAVDHLANDTEEEHIITLYHQIRNYALDHAEAAEIIRAID